MTHEILIVDDEADIRALTAGILEDEGFDAREAATSDQALEAVENRCPALVLLDIWLQGSKLDGIGILRELKKRYPSLPVVMMSGHGTIETAVEAIRIGAFDFVEKPFKADRILHAVGRAIEISELRRENEELRLRSGTDSELIGASTAINQLRQNLSKVAITNSRILISGPSGSGKEVAARQLHSLSKRANGPFVVVNCATIEPKHAEETLFGSETGDGDSDAIKVGMFERAHSGTLFLDEVSDMPMETQGKIVRVLQEQSFLRVGGRRQVNVDVRVIASSTRDLPHEIEEGRFREDLFYRLSVVPLAVPGLAQRREDIPDLCDHFMNNLSMNLGQPKRAFTTDAMALLQSYKWPGNVRELKNVIERTLIMIPDTEKGPVSADHLPSEMLSTVPDELKLDASSMLLSLPIREARDIFEREYLKAQLARYDGNISRTATFVEMERSALHRKLKALGLGGENKTSP